MGTFGWIVLGLVVVAVLVAVSPPFRRLMKAFKERSEVAAEEATEALRKQNPLGYYKLEINNAIEKGKTAQNVVKRSAKQLVSLDNQIADLTKEQTRLNNRLASVTAKGDPNGTAKDYAKQLASVESQLQANKDQRQHVQEDYDTNLKLVEKYERDVTQARRDAEQLGFQLEQSKDEKDMYEASAQLRADLNTGKLAEARKRVQDAINANWGETKAMRDLSARSSAQDKDEEDELDEEAAKVLARFQKPSSPPPSTDSAANVH